ncbi:MAG: phenylalanine--tRNA ligase subunit beta [Porticoccaceae bacterium]
MKISESWLREAVNVDLSTAELAARLTMAGLEIDSVEYLDAKFDGVVVGEIVGISTHPNADKLRICEVASAAEASVAVVCGAPNARQGLKVAFAQVGATLPGGRKIDKAKLRGVESWGMLCSAAELGISDADGGLLELPPDAPVGEQLNRFLRLDDSVIEIDLTPNRGDCLSIRGLAREVAVIAGGGLVHTAIAEVAPRGEDVFAVELLAPAACPSYRGRIIRNIDGSRVSPPWLQQKLRRSGIRAINPAVDVTNYVMLELGQPMHAFDLGCLVGGIRVRLADEGEQLKLLEGGDVRLDAGTLVIADHAKPLAIAGIMGGEASSVTPSTRDVFLESAYFSPLALAGRARSYGLHSESSHRFERGVDPHLGRLAIERATALLLAIAGGEPGPVVAAVAADHLPARPAIRLRKQRLRQQLAMAFADDLVVDILARLGVEVVATDGDGWLCTAPSWRFDIAIEADLIEELARVYGYNRLPTTTPVAPLEIAPASEQNATLKDMRRLLVARDYHEAITYSFVDPALQRLLDADGAAVQVTNPISSDMAVMRSSLWPGLLTALRYNRNRQQSRIRLFETGLRFVVEGTLLVQEKMLAGLVSGRRHSESWTQADGGVDFYDIKGDVEAILTVTRADRKIRFVPVAHPALHPGQAASMLDESLKSIGCVGKLHPNIIKELGFDQDVFLFELALERISGSELPRFVDISRLPTVRRDLAVLVDRSVTADELLRVAGESAGEYLTDLNIFDVYHGKDVESNRKSIAFGLTFQHPSRTLTDDEIATAMTAVILSLKNAFGATLRGEK